ncbi:hypothetical protein BT96DRAFT_418472 [Gymnopus androsaceus JB14]|uniref:Uncharacterized protein n=1 Tax=Gymnopus androsaceus JB14 TaxID=1447944 RepID=A0A6A4HYH5_9AGAR|nr:hypothetical protein BT96DRAFT_418472 [Gymnopus androsaceus JB14]
MHPEIAKENYPILDQKLHAHLLELFGTMSQNPLDLDYFVPCTVSPARSSKSNSTNSPMTSSRMLSMLRLNARKKRLGNFEKNIW